MAIEIQILIRNTESDPGPGLKNREKVIIYPNNYFQTFDIFQLAPFDIKLRCWPAGTFPFKPPFFNGFAVVKI